MSLGFAPRTLGCFLFDPEVPRFFIHGTKHEAGTEKESLGSCQPMVAASKEGAAGPGHVLAAKVAAAQWGTPGAAAGRQGAEQSAGGHGAPLWGRWGGESEPGVERGEEGTRVSVHFDSRAWGGLLASSRAGGGALGHGCHAPATCPPVEAFHRTHAEQQSGLGGTRFGPVLDRIWLWTKNKVCSTIDTLQL